MYSQVGNCLLTNELVNLNEFEIKVNFNNIFIVVN